MGGPNRGRRSGHEKQQAKGDQPDGQERASQDDIGFIGVLAASCKQDIPRRTDRRSRQIYETHLPDVPSN